MNIILTDVSKLIAATEDIMDEELTGETILTIGAAVAEIIDEVDGIIAIGPFWLYAAPGV